MRAQLNALNTDKASHGDVAAAIGGTANNVNGVGTLDITISDPPQQGEVQAMLDKLNELINGAHR